MKNEVEHMVHSSYRCEYHVVFAPNQIEEHLRLCKDEDVELVAEIVKFLADRNNVQ